MSNADALHALAARYTAAWCSRNAASVAAHYEPNGSLQINGGPPATGREAITAAAQSFMSAFPDMQVTMDSLDLIPAHPIYRWTLTGNNTGPNGTGRRVQISGYEEWTIAPSGRIAKSLGHFDANEYQRKLEQGA